MLYDEFILKIQSEESWGYKKKCIRSRDIIVFEQTGFECTKCSLCKKHVHRNLSLESLFDQDQRFASARRSAVHRLEFYSSALPTAEILTYNRCICNACG